MWPFGATKRLFFSVLMLGWSPAFFYANRPGALPDCLPASAKRLNRR
jgi:hypothetical protein